MDDAGSCILDVAPQHIDRLPATRLHDGDLVDTSDHHVLRCSDAHGMARKTGCLPADFCERRCALDDAPDRGGIEMPSRQLLRMQSLEQRSFLEAANLQPLCKAVLCRGREIGDPSFAKGIGFCPWDEDGRKVGREVLGPHGGKLVAAAESVIAHTDQCGIALASKAIGTGSKNGPEKIGGEAH